MTLFQILSISVLALLAVLEIVGKALGRRKGWLWLVRLSLWVSAAAAIYHPRLVAVVADTLGIGRGADLVTYAVALAFLGMCFYFYSRYTLLQQQLTDLVRHIALQDAKRGKDGDEDAS
jgi:small membrane protein